MSDEDDARSIAIFGRQLNEAAYRKMQRENIQMRGEDRYFIYEIEAKGPLPHGSEVKIHRQTIYTADGMYLTEISGARQVRRLQILPGYRVRVIGEGEFESHTVDLSDDSFKIIGVVSKVISRGNRWR